MNNRVKSLDSGDEKSCLVGRTASPPPDKAQVRRKPVPVPGRISNAELQREIDATLDVRVLGKTKLRDILGDAKSRNAPRIGRISIAELDAILRQGYVTI